MKALLASLLCASVAYAAPARKVAPDKFTRAAGDLFKAAVAADEAGDLRKAATLYEQSLELVVHPNSLFNLASVYERDGNFENAVLEYESYLVLAPTAPDAAAVRKKITELLRAPCQVTFKAEDDFDPKDAYILVDGVIVKKPGQVVRQGNATPTFVLPMQHGEHTIEVYSAVAYGASRFTTRAGGTWSWRYSARTPHVGNVAVMADIGFLVGTIEHGAGRITLPAGKQMLAVHDNDNECAPITIDAPANDDVLYVTIKPEEFFAPSGITRNCRKRTITQQRLKF